MANPAPTINQINAFNATQGTTIDFNIIGGTELVRSNRIYIYDLSDNSLICTHLYVSTESIHELPPNTDGSIVYESGKSSADFVNGAQYYAQIQTFTDIAGTEGGSGLSVAKMFWCLVDPTLTTTTIPSTISTTSYNVSATYDANTSVVSNIIQQYQFSLYSATGSLLQSSGVVVGSGEQQGTSTTYDISYNFTGLSVGSSYYVTVEVTTTQGMSITTQSNTFTVSIDTPTLGEATVVNNACDGYISVTSNLSSEYGGSGSGEIVSFETDSENVFTKLQVDLEPVQEGTPWVSASETEPYLMRISPQFDHDYNTEFDTLVGGTVAWNQLYNKTGNASGNGVTFTNVNGVITLSGVCTANQWYTLDTQSLPTNHKYLVTGGNSASTLQNAFLYVRTGNGLYTQFINGATAGIVSPCLNVSIQATNGYNADANPLKFTPQIFDLTQMFGSTVADAIYAMEQAQSGSGVSFFRKYFSKAYYAYDAGTLMSVKTSSHDTAGKNWLAPWFSTQTKYGVTWTVNADGTFTSSGTASQNSSQIVTSNIVLPDGTYIISGCPTGGSGSTYYLRALLYDSNNTLIDQWSDFGSGKTFTIDSATTAYIKVFVSVNNGQTAPSGTWKPMIRVSSANADFEPYTKNVYPLDPNLELRGIPKLVDNKLQYDGDVYSSSGNVQRKYGIVDLGTLTWTYNSTYDFLASSALPSDGHHEHYNAYIAGICSKYPFAGINSSNSTMASAGDKTLYGRTSTGLAASSEWQTVYIKDSAYTDATAFKTAMSGVYLVYEKATPTTETAMPFEANQSIVPNGSEEYVDSRTVPIPVGHLTSYADVYPITGHDSVDVEHTGKNLLDTKLYKGISYYPTVGSTPTIIENPTQLTNNGDGTFSITLTTSYQSVDFIVPIKRGVQYRWKTKIESNGTEHGVSYGYLDENHKILSRYNDTALSKQFDVTLSQDNYLTGDNGYFYVAISDRSSAGATITITQPQIELGTTATAYEPYQEQSYHQDIEVTYTPTVQENAPYLFKQTEDVGGDRETIELVGGTVAWNQQVYDGNFTDASGWTGLSGGVFSVNNNECTITVTANFMGVQTNVTNVEPSKRPTCISGHKYLISADLKASNNRNNSVGFGISHYASTHQIRKTFSVGTSYANYSFIGMQTTGTLAQTDGRFMLYDTAGGGSNCTLYAKNVYAIDLTQMFGSTIADYIYSLEQATAGAGVAWFKKLFPKPYYAYNAGELISVNATSHNTVGKNLNPYSGVNYVVDNSKERFFLKANTYTLSTDNGNQLNSGANYYIRLYDAKTSGNIITDGNITSDRLSLNGDHTMYYGGSGYASVTFTLAVDAWVCFGFNNVTPTTCNAIQLEVGSNVTDYEPYIKNTYPLDSDLTLRGIPKLDASNNLYYDGDTYKYDGSVNRKFGKVDLGTLTWQSRETTALGLFIAEMPRDYAYKYNMMGICSKYMFKGHITGTSTAVATLGEDGCGLYYSAGYTFENNPYPFFYVYDTQLSNYTPAQVKSAMSGVMFVYEKQNNLAETADAFEEIQKVTPIYGTEEFADSRTVPMPVYAKTQYLTRDVYGGYIDLVSGLLTVDDGNKIYDGSNDESWTLQSINSYGIANFYTAVSDYVGGSANQSMCNELEPQTSTISNTQTAGYLLNAYKELYVRVPSSIASTVAEFRTFLNSKPLQIVHKLATPQTYQLTPQQIETLLGQNNVWSENGEISLAYHIPITNLLVKRQDVGDVSGSWLTLYSQPITQASDMDFTFIDFTNQYGKTYKYALVPLLTQTQSGVEVEVEGGYTVSDEVQSVFDGVFIVDSTGSQKCKANVGYGNVDMNQTVGTITPIGAKYPVVITNSKNQYHNGSISGTIVPDDYYFNGNLSRIDMVNKRDELEQFLTNKRAKIIKDWNGKIWLVMIMDNVSCTFNNNYGMGIVNFSTNWVEVGDPTNQQDLQATGLINIGGA